MPSCSQFFNRLPRGAEAHPGTGAETMPQGPRAQRGLMGPQWRAQFLLAGAERRGAQQRRSRSQEAFDTERAPATHGNLLFDARRLWRKGSWRHGRLLSRQTVRPFAERQCFLAGRAEWRRRGWLLQPETVHFGHHPQAQVEGRRHCFWTPRPHAQVLGGHLLLRPHTTTLEKLRVHHLGLKFQAKTWN
jgi:hypothetical protein